MNRIFFKTLGCRLFRNLRYMPPRGFCNQKNDQQGTQYSNWVLARSAAYNHNIEHMKRKHVKDRYSIHRLTNLSFMLEMIELDHKYHLTMNQKIVLLAQIIHVVQIMNKNIMIYHQVSKLTEEIFNIIRFPDDLPCLGTLMASLSSMQEFNSESWQILTDSLLVGKFDQEYDELFGIIYSLKQYRQNLLMENDYISISKDNVSFQIPIIYRNSLEVLRQYVTHNIFNIKQCRLIFEALHQANINEGFFWKSVRDWFNIYTKEQLTKKQMDEFFIMKESAVDKILYDHGIIRPRPILQQLSSIVYILTQFGYVSWRFIQFSQDLILYAMQNGSSLYERYLQIAKKEQQMFAFQKQEQESEPLTLNQHIETYKDQQKAKLKSIEKKYRTIFVNPIELKDQYVVNLMIVFCRAYKKYLKMNIKGELKKQQQKQQNKDDRSFYDRRDQVYMDPRVKKWMLIQLVKAQMRYTVKQLLQIIECYPFMEESQINLKEFVVNKLQNLRDLGTNFKELQKIMWFITGFYFDKITPLLNHYLVRNHPSQILKMTQLIDQNQWTPYLIEYMLRLPKAVNTHQRYYSFEQNCYFLFILLKNALYWEHVDHSDPLRVEYEGQMEQLKEQIKIVTYSRGFKLSINSNFHKVMEYIDVVEFFEGGRV